MKVEENKQYPRAKDENKTKAMNGKGPRSTKWI
jgi:hypothetical protein